MSMRYGLKSFRSAPQSSPAGLDWDFRDGDSPRRLRREPAFQLAASDTDRQCKGGASRRGNYRPLPMAGGISRALRPVPGSLNRIDIPSLCSRPFPAVDPSSSVSPRLMKIDTNGMPVERNGRYFFSRRKADQDQFVIYMRKGLEGPATVLVDPHPMSPERTTSVDMMDISEDGSLLAYGVRQGGEDEVSVRLLNVDTGEHLWEELPKARYFGISLKPDKSGFYYSRHNEEGSRIYYHPMGKALADDARIFGDQYGPGQDCLFPPLRRWPLPADYCFPRVGSRPDGDLFPGRGSRRAQRAYRAHSAHSAHSERYRRPLLGRDRRQYLVPADQLEWPPGGKFWRWI